METQGIDPIHFATAMQKLTAQSGAPAGDENQREYLTTHPSSASRISKAKERSRIFNER